ncbi:MAG: DinB family protein [Candidatus Eisenbacteria bacterium]
MAARRGAKKKAARKATLQRGPKPKPRAAAKPVKKAPKAKPAKKAAKAPKAKPKPAKKAARRTPAAPAKPVQRAATKPAPVKRVVKPAKPAPPVPEFTPAFTPQRESANPKELLLFEMQRARVAIMAAIQGMTAPTAERPIAPGKWSVREIVLHLIVRDRVRLDEFGPVLGGRPASWVGLDDTAMARVNELHLGPLRPLSWEEAVRLLQATREQLVAALVTVPSHPAELWTEAHPFGAMMLALPRHDRHHAEQIKNARIEG